MSKANVASPSEQSERVECLVSCDELEIVSDLVVRLTEQRQNECKHLAIENFSTELFARLLHELTMHKKGMIRADWLNISDS